MQRRGGNGAAAAIAIEEGVTDGRD